MIDTRNEPPLLTLGIVLCALAACGDPGETGYFVDGTTPGERAGDPNGGPSAGSSSSSSSSSSGSTSSSGSSGAPGTQPAAACAKSTKTYGTLEAWECVPSNAPAKAGLVVALHGYTQGVEQGGGAGQPWGYKPTTQWEVLAEKHKFYVLYPDKGTQAFSWYTFFGTSGIGRNDLEPSNIAKMVRDFIAEHDVDPEKVFVNGLSAGGYMTVVMLATYPDLFAGGSTFAGGAYGCTTSCAALGKKGSGWTWPGNHSASLVKQAHPAVWNDTSARKPRLMVFQGDADGAVTMENLADLTQQWNGAIGIAGAGTKSSLKGHEVTDYEKNGTVMVRAVRMAGIGHGTPVDPGTGADQGGWDPEPSKTMQNDSSAMQDWTNTAGIYGPYYSAKFWALIP